MNRHHEHDGRWWFAVCFQNCAMGDAKYASNHKDVIVRNLSGPRRIGTGYFLPLDQVKITDALACSRAELGPVYVIYTDWVETPECLLAVMPDRVVTGIWSMQSNNHNDFRLATPDELKAAGLWEES